MCSRKNFREPMITMWRSQFQWKKTHSLYKGVCQTPSFNYCNLLELIDVNYDYSHFKTVDQWW